MLKPGAKGAAWEREVGRLLSLWLTRGEQPDIFARNVLSGGAFTLATERGKRSARMPGDLMASHPSAFRFLEQFSIECKHLKDIGLIQYLLDPRGMTPLGKIIALAKRQARHINVEYMVIAKQNRMAALVFVSGAIGERMLNSLVQYKGRVALMPMHHKFHGGSVVAFRLKDLVLTIDPDLLLRKI